MAASIPVLRVLVRNVKASARDRYGMSNLGNDTYRKTTTRSNTVVISTTNSRGHKGSQSSVSASPVRADDGSDRSILPVGDRAISGNRILRTQEIAVEHHDLMDEEGAAFGTRRVGRAL
jgi:hypothetical protein